jgi:exodeoxyribonuclease V gamma subunit
MTLHLHRATRADRLATGLGELLTAPFDDPFTTEIVAVSSPGVERWLAQQLATQLGRTPSAAAGDIDDTPGPVSGDGICAGIDFWSPRRLTGQALATVTGIEPRTDPWRPRRSVWPLLSVIDSVGGQEWASPLTRYLAVSSRRFSTARRVAQMFDRYSASRPQMIMRWADGVDTDSDGNPLPEGSRWQPKLWRLLREHIGVPSPAERLAGGCRVLRADPGATELPARLSIFDPAWLDYATLTVLSALSHNRDVHLWLPHASPALWSKVAYGGEPDRAAVGHDVGTAGLIDGQLGHDHVDGDEVDGCARSDGAVDGCARSDDEMNSVQLPGRRVDDPTTTLGTNRLLTYLGRDARELQLCLNQLPAAISDQLIDAPTGDQPDRRLLALVQADLTADRSASDADGLPRLDATDDSIQVHASHGPDRQVEVLREVVLGLLADDPTLEPRDIVVMCPDVETFAPLISASFGARPDDQPESLVESGSSPNGSDQHGGRAGQAHPGHHLRVQLADRSLRQVNPMLQLLNRLFDLADSRAEASVVLDLCSFEPVATKFGFSPDDLVRLRELVARSGVRWGFDAPSRARFGLAGYAQNTWAAGLDRLLLGVAMDEETEQFLGTTLPMDDVDASDIDLVGRLAEAVTRIMAVTERFSRRQALHDWVDSCRAALDLLTAAHPNNRWQTAQAYAELARIAETATANTAPLSTSEASAMLATALAGHPSRASFRTGTLTVAAMHSMRSVPHRVVCLLGLDDGVFPRTDGMDGDDLLATDPRVGDRDRRSEDRQLLLDAIMAAGDHLVVLYSGADPRTNAARSPSVPVSELLDACDRTAQTADGLPARQQILRRHPLQPFDPDNFGLSPSGLDGVADHAGPFSFDHDALAGARAIRASRSDPEPVYSRRPLAPVEPGPVIQLAELIRFFAHPPRAYLRARAGLSILDDEKTEPDDMPVGLDPLQSWEVGNRMLQLHLKGIELSQVVGAEWRRGNLPPRELGRRALEPVAATVAGLAERSRSLRTGDRRTVDIVASVQDGQAPRGNQLGDGSDQLTVIGTVSDVFGDHQVTTHYSRLAAKHRLESWIKLVALTVTDPRPWQVTAVGRGFGQQPAQSTLGPIEPKIARRVLADLVDLYRIGLSEPLPLPPKTSAKYAQVRLDGHSVDVVRAKLAHLWNQDRDPTYEAFFGADAEYDQLLADPSIPDEERGSCAEPSRFGSLARRVWQPLLQAEMWN